MLIGIDGNEANVEKRVGISEYAFELLQQFSNSKFNSAMQNQNSKFTIYLKDKPREDLPKEREGWSYRVVWPRKLWTQIGLPFDLFTHFPRPDVFFTPTHYAARFSPVPAVISIMDLSFIHYPYMFKKSDLYQLRNWTKYSAKKAVKILTISNSSKNDIIKIYRVPETKIIVTYPGIKLKTQMFRPKADQPMAEKFKMQNSKILGDKYGIKGNYILFVGTLQPRKNIIRLIEAFTKVFRGPVKSEDLALIIIGKKGWLYEEILEAPKKFEAEEKVKFLEFVPDEDLENFYKNALCFVLPSLYEGFGLPVLEAMKYGCPVITSNVSSLPEAGGDAALYIDPENVDDIAEKIQKIISDQKLRNDMIEKGYQQIKKFSWEKTAKETLKVLEEVGEKARE